MTKSVTPKGVEHNATTSLALDEALVTKSVTPKGVEHYLLPSDGQVGRRDQIRDAERR